MKLVTIKPLSDALGVPVRTIRELKRKRLIPYIRAGHRTHFFDAEKVRAALDRFEVKEVQ